MNKTPVIAVLILIVLAGVGLFFFNISTTVSYLAIGVVIAAFIALLFITRKKQR
ncbi:MAG: LPXTG cell wall anchor domain-containing protein [Dissulfurispiraceae bacterium]|jgi:LPXTG-motif cell wall-anchored protein